MKKKINVGKFKVFFEFLEFCCFFVNYWFLIFKYVINKGDVINISNFMYYCCISLLLM